MNKEQTAKRNVPILAVDDFEVNVTIGGSGRFGGNVNQIAIPTTDIFFNQRDGDDKEVVAAVRLNYKHVEELQDKLVQALTEFRANHWN